MFQGIKAKLFFFAENLGTKHIETLYVTFNYIQPDPVIAYYSYFHFSIKLPH